MPRPKNKRNTITSINCKKKKNTLMQEYSLNKEQFSDLVQYRKNYENYYGIEVER